MSLIEQTGWNDKKSKLLLAFMLHYRSFYERIENRINTYDLVDQMEYEIAVILEAVDIYKDKHGDLPDSKLMLEPYINDAIRKFPELEDEKELIKDINENWLGTIGSILKNNTDELKRKKDKGKSLLRDFFWEFYGKRKLSSLKSEDNIFNVREELLDLESDIFDLTRPEKKVLEKPFMNIEKGLQGLAINPSGVPVWDRLFKGIRPSEMALILGGTGFGKTTLAVQVGSHYAKEGNRVLHVSYEQELYRAANPRDPSKGVRSELKIMALCSILDISRENFSLVDDEGNVKGWEDIPQTIRDNIKKLENSPLGENYNVVDFSDAMPGDCALTSLLRFIEEEHKKEPIDLLIIDPFWPLVLKTCAAKDVPINPKRTRAEAQNMAETIHSFCVRTSIPVIMVHQLGASAAQGKEKASSYGSAEIKTLAWRIENVVAIVEIQGRRKTGLLRVKSRFSGEINKMMPVTFDGENCKFKQRNAAEEDNELLGKLEGKTVENNSDEIVGTITAQ